MASRLNPYLNFDGTTREAMEFYRDVLGGRLDISTFGEFGGEPADGVMHANLHTDDDFTLMASDTPPGMEFTPGPANFSVSLSGDAADGERLRGYFAKLSEGGEVTMPLEKQMWGDEFGMVTDRFGTPWMVNIGQG